MVEVLLDNEAMFRVGIFVVVLLLMLVLEKLYPRRTLTQKRFKRWFVNVFLVVASALVLRFFLPLVAVGMAQIAVDRHWGLLNLVNFPGIVEIAIAVVLFDFSIYLQHVLSHRLPVLWRLHKIHHADRDIDTTTGIRFHPVEILLSMIYKMVVVVILGPAVIAVIIFEIVLSASALFNHSNFNLRSSFDKCLRFVIVTPDMHRVHHSVYSHETNSNYGFFLSCWDRIFSTYIEQPKGGHQRMKIGLDDYQNDKPSSIGWALTSPFRQNQ